MKALSIKQPWASLIIRGGKDIENREWRTHYRGIVAIHASAKMDRSEMEDACDFMRIFVPRFSADRFKADVFPCGAILGTVDLVDCVTVTDSPWFVGHYGFVLQNPVAFELPIPCRGKLGFWDIPEAVMPSVREWKVATRKVTA